MRDVQANLQSLLTQLVADGRERGVQLAVYHRGKLVIDCFAGTMDGSKPVDGRTLFPVFSVTKGLAATLAHWLVERGKISYDTPIAEVWPAFAANGKGNILFRHVLSHTAGLQHVPVGLTAKDLANWETMSTVMAAAKPVSAPGAEVVYHAVTYGWLVGEVLRRVDGRPFGKMLQEEVCRPLGLRDLFVGLPAEFDSRVATLDELFEPAPPDSPPQAPADPNVPREIPAYMWPLHTWMNTPEARRACVPASNGIANARDLARHYAALIPGGVDGVELLSPARVKLATQLTIPGNPPPNGDYKKIGLGYFLGGDPNGMGSRLSIFGHGGYGGAMGYADPEMQLAVGFTKNLYSKRGASGDVFRAVRAALGVPD